MASSTGGGGGGGRVSMIDHKPISALLLINPNNGTLTITAELFIFNCKKQIKTHH